MTIYDIASEAGVSISTVSRVLNNPDKVPAKTLEKVRAVIRKHNYTPNAMARGLVSHSMKTIGILTSDIRNYHFACTAYTLENLFFNWGYSVILCNTGNKSEKKRDYIHILAEKKVDGIILVGSVFTDIDIESSVRQYLPNTPIVVANSSISVPNVHYVLIDHTHGMDLAVQHLWEKGHREIRFVNTSVTFNGKRKEQGFRQAMEKYGLPQDKDSVLHSEFGLAGAGEVIDRVLESQPATTALIFADDNTALCGIKRLRERGRAVPGDMAVIGYDNSDYSLYAEPQMTTIDTKNEAFSTLVANMLHDILHNKEVGTSVILTPDIVVRDST